VPGFTSKGNYSEWYQHALEEGDSATVAYHKANYGDNSYYKFADHLLLTYLIQMSGRNFLKPLVQNILCLLQSTMMALLCGQAKKQQEIGISMECCRCGTSQGPARRFVCGCS
jgi:hypothetical protein